jgi:long-chain acyl-CoA synthetase
MSCVELVIFLIFAGRLPVTLFSLYTLTMSFELDTLSYALLTSIAGAAALLSVRNSKTADIHPLLLNTQSDVARLRLPEESAVYRSRMYPMKTPLCSTFDRNVRTMADFYKAGGIAKNASADFLSSTTGYVSIIMPTSAIKLLLTDIF